MKLFKSLLAFVSIAASATSLHAQPITVSEPPPVQEATGIPQNLTPRQDSKPAGSMHMIEVLDLLPTEPDADNTANVPLNDQLAIDNAAIPPISDIPAGIDPNAPIDVTALPPAEKYNAVVLNGINKITARSEQVSGAVGTVMRFNTLEIIAHDCQSIMDNSVRGFAALLEIWELKSGDTPKKILQGWMFSTSPSLFGLEHPLYDIGVRECTNIDPEAESKAVPKVDVKKAAPKKADKPKQ